MDIIKKTIILKNNDIINKIHQIIENSKNIYNKIFDKDIDYKSRIKLLIEDTFISDIYLSIINLMILISEKEDYKNWIQAESLLKKYNIEINKNDKLLEFLIESIKHTDDFYDKVFLAKIGKSLNKFGINNEKKEKITKIIEQLDKTENDILNNLDKSISFKINRNKIDARSDSIMSSVYPDDNNMIYVNKKKYLYLIKKISDNKIKSELEDLYMKRFNQILPLIGKVLILRDTYAKYMSYSNYYEFISEKSDEETEIIQQLITDLNMKLDIPLENILKQFHQISKKNKITFNDIIYLIDKNSVNIKLKPVDILQIVMITVQKKFNMVFKHSTNDLGKSTNCIEIYKNNQLKGYLILDLTYRPNKRITQLTTIKLNNKFSNNLPCIYLLGCYDEIEKNNCNFSELVLLFREFGNILINIFQYTPNGLNDIDLEMFNFFPDIMEFMAYDNFVLTLIAEKLKFNVNKFIKEMKILRRIELIINLKLRCMNILFDNIVHSSQTLINQIKKQELNDITNSLIELNNKIFNDIFKNNLNYIKNTDYIQPNIIYNLVNGNQGLLFGSVLSIILAYSVYYLIINKNDNIDIEIFLNKLLENKEYSYKKNIIDFISKNNIDYFKLFTEKCLEIIEDNNNLFDEQTEKE
jgi:hypothetical protein